MKTLFRVVVMAGAAMLLTACASLVPGTRYFGVTKETVSADTPMLKLAGFWNILSIDNVEAQYASESTVFLSPGPHTFTVRYLSVQSNTYQTTTTSSDPVPLGPIDFAPGKKYILYDMYSETVGGPAVNGRFRVAIKEYTDQYDGRRTRPDIETGSLDISWVAFTDDSQFAVSIQKNQLTVQSLSGGTPRRTQVGKGSITAAVLKGGVAAVADASPQLSFVDLQTGMVVRSVPLPHPVQFLASTKELVVGAGTPGWIRASWTAGDPVTAVASATPVLALAANQRSSVAVSATATEFLVWDFAKKNEPILKSTLSVPLTRLALRPSDDFVIGVTKDKTLSLFALPSGDRVPIDTMTDSLFRFSNASNVGFSPDGQHLIAARSWMDGLTPKTGTYFWPFAKADPSAPLSLGGDFGSRRFIGTSNGSYHSAGFFAASPDQTKIATVAEWQTSFGLVYGRTLYLYDLTKEDPIAKPEPGPPKR